MPFRHSKMTPDVYVKEKVYYARLYSKLEPMQFLLNIAENLAIYNSK